MGSSISRASWDALGFLVVALAVGWTVPAEAFCVARSCDPDANGGNGCELDSDTGCSVDGVELRRPNGCINIAVRKGSARSVPGLTDEEFEQLVLEGFAQWASVDCGEGPPAIQIQSAGIVEIDDAFACRSMPGLNLDQWMLSTDLSSSQVVTSTSGAVAGTTFPSFLLETGEVFDADVKVNALWVLVQDEDKMREHLRTVATHEAGHVLGLTHSKNESALMFASYTVTGDRVPTADDVQGICELFPPGELECGPPTDNTAALGQQACDAAYRRYQSQQHQEILNTQAEPSCACAIGHHTTPWGVLSTLLTGSLLRRFRRRDRAAKP